MLASRLIPLAYCNDLRLISSFTLYFRFHSETSSSTQLIPICGTAYNIQLYSSQALKDIYSGFQPAPEHLTSVHCEIQATIHVVTLQDKPLNFNWISSTLCTSLGLFSCMKQTTSSSLAISPSHACNGPAFKHLFTSLLPLLHLQHLYISYMQHFTPPLTEQLVFCAASNQFSVWSSSISFNQLLVSFSHTSSHFPKHWHELVTGTSWDLEHLFCHGVLITYLSQFSY